MKIDARFPRMILACTIVLAALGAVWARGRREHTVTSGTELLARMREQRAWNSGCVVIETSASFRSGREDRWHEIACAPGLRRIDLLPADSLSGLLFRHDSLYEMKAGLVAHSQALSHPLSILMYDAASAPLAETVSRLEMAGFDLGNLRLSTWQERPAYVIGGGGETDRSSTQFWVDVERLVLVRLIESTPREDAKPGDPPLVREVWLDDYVATGNHWFPGQLSFFRNGERFLVEKMSVIATGITVDSSAFVPVPWMQPIWLAGSRAVTARN
jgi:hypothetical protein